MKHLCATAVLAVLLLAAACSGRRDQAAAAPEGRRLPKGSPSRTVSVPPAMARTATARSRPTRASPASIPSYLYKQLPDFKAGGVKNAVMSGMVATLPTTTCATSLPTSPRRSPGQAPPRTRSLVAAGQKLYRGGDSDTGVPACSGCHSPNGAGIPAQYPRLTGQHVDYTLAQLQAFRSGRSRQRLPSMMRTIAGRLTDKEMAAVAEYISGLR